MGILSKAGRLARMTYAYLAVPVMTGKQFIPDLIENQGNFREALADYNKRGGCWDGSYRQKFNDFVRGKANKLTSLKQRVNYGPGDLLTEPINLRKIGASAGALAPLAALYFLGIHNAQNPVAAVAGTLAFSVFCWPLVVGGSVFLGLKGYRVGNKLDRLLGDDSPRNMAELENRKSSQ